MSVKAGCRSWGGMSHSGSAGSCMAGGQSRRCHLDEHGRGLSSSGAPGVHHALQLQPGSPLKLSSLQAHRSMALPRVRVGVSVFERLTCAPACMLGWRSGPIESAGGISGVGLAPRPAGAPCPQRRIENRRHTMSAASRALALSLAAAAAAAAATHTLAAAAAHFPQALAALLLATAALAAAQSGNSTQEPGTIPVAFEGRCGSRAWCALRTLLHALAAQAGWRRTPASK